MSSIGEEGVPQLQAGPLPLPHFAPKAKRVIYLFQSGGPSQLDFSTTNHILTSTGGRGLTRLNQERTKTYGYDVRSGQISSYWKLI